MPRHAWRQHQIDITIAISSQIPLVGMHSGGIVTSSNPRETHLSQAAVTWISGKTTVFREIFVMIWEWVSASQYVQMEELQDGTSRRVSRYEGGLASIGCGGGDWPVCLEATSSALKELHNFGFTKMVSWKLATYRG